LACWAHSRHFNPASDLRRSDLVWLSGYIVGQNIIIEERWADGHFDRLAKLVEDLVRLNVEVVLAVGGTPSIRAAKNATSKIPIVFAGLGTDPVELGLVKSFARPGGNVTGVGSGGPELYEKRLELLKETVPTLSLVAYLRNPDNPAARLTEAAIRGVARLLRVKLLPLDVRSPRDLGSAFENAPDQKQRGLSLRRVLLLAKLSRLSVSRCSTGCQQCSPIQTFVLPEA
jgi:putative tryptophan/tyrosine transport system substrate-binding protein